MVNEIREGQNLVAVFPVHGVSFPIIYDEFFVDAFLAKIQTYSLPQYRAEQHIDSFHEVVAVESVEARPGRHVSYMEKQICNQHAQQSKAGNMPPLVCTLPLPPCGYE